MVSGSYRKIYEVVQQIPAGKVATYGQVAKLAGIAGQARQVGYALSNLNDSSVPWHRVINARGEISRRRDSAYETLQRDLLEQEGIKFSVQGKVAFDVYRWEP